MSLGALFKYAGRSSWGLSAQRDVGMAEVEVEERAHRGVLTGPGSCTGRIDGRAVGHTSISVLQAQLTGTAANCATARFSGPGTLTVGGVPLPVTVGIVRPDVSLGLQFDVLGTISGSGEGRGNVNFLGSFAPRPLNDGGLACLAPTGTNKDAVDLPFTTRMPLISTVPDAPAVRTPRVGLRVFDQRTSTVLRTGVVRTRCTVPAAGRCRVRVVRGGRTLASGSATGAAGRSVLVRARLTRAGRRALRRSGLLRATVRASATGAASRVRTVVLR